MKKFIVDTGKKKYIVKAKDAKRAVELVKKIDDNEDDIGLSLERSLRTLSSKYTVGKIYDYIRTHAVYGVPNNPDAINRVKEVLSKNGATKIKVVKNDYGFAIVCFKAKDSINGTVTEKNLEDSTKDNFYAVRTRNNGRVGEWYVKANSEQKAFDIVKRQPGHQFDVFVSIKQVSENELKRVGARVIS